MFGEDLEEGGGSSSRASSPWNNLVATPPSSSPHLQAITGGELARIPKLVPEVEEGNVEYKLKLLNPTSARFARLVTQLKWRLLEGSGQAYYEIGVADSGMLVGLPRAQLEASLETLEMMAGEIGASVIVIKEVEVPRAMVDIAERLALRQPDDADAGWDMMRMGSWESRARKRLPFADPSLPARTPKITHVESDADDEPDEPDLAWGSASHQTITPARPIPVPAIRFHPPAVASSPFDLDSDLAFFSTESDPDSSSGWSDADADAPPAPQFDIALAIASVYKPRPARRAPHAPVPGGKRKDKEKPLKVKARDFKTKAQDKAAKRRDTRDRRREERRRALVGDSDHADNAILVVDPVVQPPAEETTDLAAGLDALHVSSEQAPVVQASVVTTVEEVATSDDDVLPWGKSDGTSNVDVDVDVDVDGRRDDEKTEEYEPRLIVEALVVRKMSMEEAFLDLEGFEIV